MINNWSCRSIFTLPKNSFPDVLPRLCIVLKSKKYRSSIALHLKLLYMFYYKKIKDVLLLEDELKKLKSAYARVIKKTGDSTAVADLRKMIKLLSGRINTLKQEEESLAGATEVVI